MLIAVRSFDENHKTGWAKAEDHDLDPIACQRAGKPPPVSELREVWETAQNRALERADIRDELGELVQVDRRSCEERGLEIEPTIKLGPAATEMQRRGEDSDRAAINGEIWERTAQVDRIITHIEDRIHRAANHNERPEREPPQPVHQAESVTPRRQAEPLARQPDERQAEPVMSEAGTIRPDPEAERVFRVVGDTLEATLALGGTVRRGAATVAGVIGDGLAKAFSFLADMFTGAATSEAPPSASKSGGRLRPCGRKWRNCSRRCRRAKPCSSSDGRGSLPNWTPRYRSF